MEASNLAGLSLEFFALAILLDIGKRLTQPNAGMPRRQSFNTSELFIPAGSVKVWGLETERIDVSTNASTFPRNYFGLIHQQTADASTSN